MLIYVSYSWLPLSLTTLLDAEQLRSQTPHKSKPCNYVSSVWSSRAADIAEDHKRILQSVIFHLTGDAKRQTQTDQTWLRTIENDLRLHIVELHSATRLTIDELFESDDTLFNSVINNPDHDISLLPPSKNTGYNLHKLNHGLNLPTVRSSLQRKNFIY